MSYIPGIDHIFIFGNSIAEGAGSPFEQSNNVFVQKGIYNIPFWYEPKNDGISDPNLIFNPNYDTYKALLLFIYAIVYGLFSSLCYAILYIIGGCSAGGDFISIYYSSIRHKPLGGLMIVVNSSLQFIGAIVGSYISAGLVDPQGFSFAFLLSANLVASFLSILVFGLLLNRFFPLHRVVKVEIMSDRLLDIRDKLFQSHFTHSMTITKSIGAYSMKEKDIL
jgi:uncharacterized membrane-anchored protein YitT (DUF2179 family)